jgi:hypothetical protein
MKNEKPILHSKSQSLILNSFVRLFLPRTGNKRKNTGNELAYIHSTLDKLFIQHFGFNLCIKDVINVFHVLGYCFYSLKGEWNPENKDIRPSKHGTLVSGNASYQEFNASFVYIEVKASDVRSLMRLTTVLPSHTNLDKKMLNESLMKEFTLFKNSVI